MSQIITDRSVSRFWSKVQKTDGCWIWVGFRDKRGYGRFNAAWPEPVVLAHRFSFGLARGWPIDGCVLHQCDNPSCVNPAHLYVGTRQDNVRDMVNRRRHNKHSRTHCAHGHEYAGENLIVYNWVRYCRECMNRYRRASMKRRVRCGTCGHDGRRVIPSDGVVTCMRCGGVMCTRDQREPKDADVAAEDVA